MLSLLAAPLAAQTPAPAPTKGADSTDVVVFDHLFQTGLLEHEKVFLEKGAVYRAELNYPDVQLQVYTDPGMKPPYIIATGHDLDASKRITYEVYPDQDGEVEFRVIGGEPGGATRLVLIRDYRLSRRRKAIADAPGWAIGIELQAGLHSSYAGDTAIGTGGTSIEACLSFRAGPGLAAGTSGCAFGIEWQSNVSSYRLNYFYIEPRFRLFGRREAAGKTSTEGGLLFRGAFGSFQQRNGPGTPPHDPTFLGIGAYIGRDIVADQKGDGWAVQGSVMEGFAIGIGGDQIQGRKNAHFTAFKLGVGRYF
ncbi:MAG: hypothetical protein ACHQXA_06940 [Gemmatimonadales bacterium]